MCVYGVVGKKAGPCRTKACGTHSFVRFRREKKIDDGLFFSLWGRGESKKKVEEEEEKKPYWLLSGVCVSSALGLLTRPSSLKASTLLLYNPSAFFFTMISLRIFFSPLLHFYFTPVCVARFLIPFNSQPQRSRLICRLVRWGWKKTTGLSASHYTSTLFFFLSFSLLYFFFYYSFSLSLLAFSPFFLLGMK